MTRRFKQLYVTHTEADLYSDRRIIKEFCNGPEDVKPVEDFLSFKN